MDRRKAIKRIGASFGAITISSGVISLVQSCNSPTTNKELSFFSKNEINFLDRILEIIIPETDSPGANSLNLSKFVDAYVAKNIRTEDQKYLNAMIEEFIKNLREKYSDESLEEKKKKKKKDDRCTRIAKRKYKAWPSAYASGAVVKCRQGKIWKKLKEDMR